MPKNFVRKDSDPTMETPIIFRCEQKKGKQLALEQIGEQATPALAVARNAECA